jgi:hypothetical protein
MANEDTSNAYYSESLNLIDAKAGYSTTQANTLISTIQNWYNNFAQNTQLTDIQSAQENELIDEINSLTDNDPSVDNQSISYVAAPSYGDFIPNTPAWMTEFSNTVKNPGAAIASLIENNLGAVIIGSAVIIGAVVLIYKRDSHGKY